MFLFLFRINQFCKRCGEIIVLGMNAESSERVFSEQDLRLICREKKLKYLECSVQEEYGLIEPLEYLIQVIFSFFIFLISFLLFFIFIIFYFFIFIFILFYFILQIRKKYLNCWFGLTKTLVFMMDLLLLLCLFQEWKQKTISQPNQFCKKKQESSL